MCPHNQAFGRECEVGVKRRKTKYLDIQVFCLYSANSCRKLFIVEDAPLLLKNLRNHLIQGPIIYLPSEVVKEQNLVTNEVSLAHIQVIILMEEQNEFKLCPQLTASCLAIGHYDKMKVGPTHVLINNFVAVALRYYVNLKSNLKIGIRGVWKPVQAGIALTTTSMLALQEMFLKDRNFKFILLSRFSQDAIENLFSTIRLKNPVPIFKEFKTCLRLIFLSQYFTSGVKGNSFSDTDEEMGTPIFQLYSENKNFIAQEFSDESVLSFVIDFEKSEIEVCVEMHNEIVTIALPESEENSLYYLCGCIGKIILSRSKL
ncbi:hypothetical protein AVEN_8386-1 [Araneus ventricosus]|uniref:Transposable element P transposase n=1 Tax=Araneus ventricosus TaxID=182803 RepID=A0A4Y2KEZ5_ARAVE|nr:hypothetical protein AVEN_8386-1 [Araneus ventricosus]